MTFDSPLTRSTTQSHMASRKWCNAWRTAPVSGAARANVEAMLMPRATAAHDLDITGLLSVHSHGDLTIKAPCCNRHILANNWFVFENENLVASSHTADRRQPPDHELVSCRTSATGTSPIAADIISGSETPYELSWPSKSAECKQTWCDTSLGGFPIKVQGAFVGNVASFVGHAFDARANTAIERVQSEVEATTSLSRCTAHGNALSDRPTPTPSVPIAHATDEK